MPRYREEVINIELAKLLGKYDLRAEPETIKNALKRRPDIMILLEGVKLNLEGRFEDSSQAGHLEQNCKERVEEGIADISIGVLYSIDLKEAANIKELTKKLEGTLYKAFLVYYSSDGIRVLKLGNLEIKKLIEQIHNIFFMIIKNDVVRTMVKEVESVITKTTRSALEEGFFFSSDKLVKELKESLGIKE